MHSTPWDLSQWSGGSLIEESDDCGKLENKILKQKLQSKSEALVILTKELEKLRSECEDYKELTRRLQNRNFVPGAESFSYNSRTFRDHVIANHFSDLRDENQRLLTDRDNLRRCLSEREEDVRLLRDQLYRQKIVTEEKTQAIDNLQNTNSSTDDLIFQLEKLQIKCTGLRQDLQSLLDEKEDLVQERDAYKSKVHRLNHSMGALLKSNSYKLVDIDALLSENRYLHESLQQVREEKKLANEMGIRYKCALEKSKPSGLKELGGSGTSQIQEQIFLLITKTSFPCPANLDLTKPESLQELCLNLLETLNDRMLQLKHQRKANKHILDRLNQLESKIMSKNKEIGDLILRPSQHMLKDYSQFNVEEDIFRSPTNTATPSTDGFEDKYDDDDKTTSESSSHIIDTNSEKSCDQSSSLVFNPPDVVPIEEHQPLNTLKLEEDSDLLSEPIVLPDHLQKLVDEAMKDLLCHGQD